MRGSLKQRYKGSWSIILDLGYQTDPETGKRKRRQKWITFVGPRKGPGGAEAKLTELLREANTIGSKSSDVEIPKYTVEIKAAIERLREQVQNVE